MRASIGTFARRDAETPQSVETCHLDELERREFQDARESPEGRTALKAQVEGTVWVSDANDSGRDWLRQLAGTEISGAVRLFSLMSGVSVGTVEGG